MNLHNCFTDIRELRYHLNFSLSTGNNARASTRSTGGNGQPAMQSCNPNRGNRSSATQENDGHSSLWTGVTLSNSRQTGFKNLFVGYKCAIELSGLSPLQAIHKDLIPIPFEHPETVINPEMYKRPRKFLESRGIICIQTELVGKLIPRRIITTVF